MHPDFIEKWDKIGKDNDMFYFKAFRNIPHNEFKTFD